MCKNCFSNRNTARFSIPLVKPGFSNRSSKLVQFPLNSINIGLSHFGQHSRKLKPPQMPHMVVSGVYWVDKDSIPSGGAVPVAGQTVVRPHRGWG